MYDKVKSCNCARYSDTIKDEIVVSGINGGYIFKDYLVNSKKNLY